MSPRPFSSFLVRRKKTEKDGKGRKRTENFFFHSKLLISAENDFKTYFKVRVNQYCNAGGHKLAISCP